MRPQPDFVHEFVPGNSPRGKILENGMPRFFRRLAEGVFDLEDLKMRTNELADFVAAAVRHYKLDAEKIVGVGYSNGANIAASMLLLRPELLRAAVLFRAMVPLIPDNMPDLSSVHVWIGAGNEDPIIPTSETQRLVELLRTAGADVTIRFFNAGHGLTSSEVETAGQWLKDLKPPDAQK